MNLTVRRLDRFSQVEEIYASRMPQDFDPDEIRPLFSLRKSWERKEYICYGLSGSAGLVAYAFFVHRGRHLLLDYLAVSETHRGEGLGSAFLKELSDRIPDAECVLVEAQDPNAAQEEGERSLRQRRIGFYLRSGFYDTGLRSRVFGVDYCLLDRASGREVPVPGLREIYADMYRSMLPPRLFDANFCIKEPCRSET
ncbi:MAG: GNAT family N-acetyltransferase [Eubacteriales bacterium]|jgi:GNAT superfamily N-acetyltransferase|nr:GNAT family N-acetyltransferase [Oscillospiraceae bacterium]MBQ1402649.1 GNAT family N-acetyltransferase [Oscillospiraceae bacterium]MBQ1577716.1 GNAT family N-acetyltransferase [Oscillospiraceae bacterium]MBQ1791633.1 GNAT family N-acetyltransferase [Oscillospiraceae bacterium]MBQ2073061.1 GNAT family N-acetyltransferase [Oscillospiraceae bacterium]